jgi:hypothetical protein
MLPDSIRYFKCSSNKITSFFIDNDLNGLILPNSLVMFDCFRNEVISFSGLHLNNNLLTFYCSGNNITDSSGLKLNSKLENLVIDSKVILTNVVFPQSFDRIRDDVIMISPIFNSVLRRNSRFKLQYFDVTLYTREQLIFLFLNIDIEQYLSYDKILSSLLR